MAVFSNALFRLLAAPFLGAGLGIWFFELMALFGSAANANQGVDGRQAWQAAFLFGALYGGAFGLVYWAVGEGLRALVKPPDHLFRLNASVTMAFFAGTLGAFFGPRTCAILGLAAFVTTYLAGWKLEKKLDRMRDQL